MADISQHLESRNRKKKRSISFSPLPPLRYRISANARGNGNTMLRIKTREKNTLQNALMLTMGRNRSAPRSVGGNERTQELVSFPVVLIDRRNRRKRERERDRERESEEITSIVA